jgi:hypothetical protein
MNNNWKTKVTTVALGRETFEFIEFPSTIEDLKEFLMNQKFYRAHIKAEEGKAASRIQPSLFQQSKLHPNQLVWRPL